MTTFNLEIQFDSAGLTTLQEAGQQVAIVKNVSPNTSNQVIWVSFAPELDNTVTWTETYYVYGSNTQIQAGATIHTLSTFQGTDGDTYPFSGGQFHPGTNDLGQNQYGVKNADSNFQLLTAGLAQAAGGTGGTGGNLSPLNATVVPFNDQGIYQPIEKVAVFAFASANNGLVISSVSSNALTVDLTTEPSQTIHYNSSNNTFSDGPLSS